MPPKDYQEKIHGVGLGLRSEHYQEIISQSPKVPWFEALTDNYLSLAGTPLHHLCMIAEQYPVTLHGVNLSVGSACDLNEDYLTRLKKLADLIKAPMISDHLCWTNFHGYHSHELLPLPYTEETVNVVSNNIKKAQDFLERPLMLENVSSYLSYEGSELSEWEFVNAIAESSQCGILLDINNIYVSSQNHHFNAEEYLHAIQPQHVWQFHLAGFTQEEGYLLDSHGEQIHPPVWDLYQKALNHFGNVPTLIEWDNHIPDFATLLAEAHKAAQYQESVCEA